ncbi:hypothetical protein OK074_3755 [Actinobacteria bacterium OK074]|nr:hypothetical protein OK074_3755 [Actinobacteria bacterium OK074]
MSGTPRRHGPDPKTTVSALHRVAFGRFTLRQLLTWSVVAVAVLGMSGAAWAVPQVRGVLRDSFTERQEPYLELYFAKDPYFDGDQLVVPVDLFDHESTTARREVVVSVTTVADKPLASRTVTVTTRPGVKVTTDVRLLLRGRAADRAAEVRVTLPGHPQHLRLHLQ